MNKKVWSVYFSPADTTKQVANFIAGRIAAAFCVEVNEVDFTRKDARGVRREFGENDVIVFGSPVYAGRIPNKIMPDWKECFTGNGAAAVPVCTFGNRNFDAATDEFHIILQQSGFRVIAKAAIACQHVFSEIVGMGRPDEDDWAEIRNFADNITPAFIDKSDLRLPEDTVIRPYYTPLKADGSPAKFLKAKPLTSEYCVNCGICVKACPMGSIDSNNPRVVSGICIKCQACVLKCPMKSKYFMDDDFLSHIKMLEENYTSRSESMYVLE